MARDLGSVQELTKTNLPTKGRDFGSVNQTAASLSFSQSTLDRQRQEQNRAAQVGIGSKIDPEMASIGVGITPASGPVAALGGFLKEIGRPIARGVANIANTFTAATQGKEAADKQAAEGVDLPIYGATKPIGATGRGFGADLIDTYGTGTEAAATVIPAGRGAKIAEQTLKNTLLGSAKTGAKAGATSGALFGAGREAQNPESTPMTIAGQGALGGATGAVGGAVLAPAAGLIGGDVARQTSEKIRNYYAQKGANPQLITSTGRLKEAAPLVGAGAARQRGLVELYDDFAKQEQKHIADIKQDPAISRVGETIGDEYENVVKLRRDAGKKMGDELKQTGAVPVELDAPLTNLQQELIDNGATYDSINRQIVGGPTSKFSTADKQLMTKYASELQELGRSPSMAQLDAFVSRIPNEIEGLKATAGINFMTNAERIIKKSLDDMRESLTSAGTPAYKEARSTYSDLSKFLEEGGSFLGKKTQSGDYARDASLAKSAVQSVLNNGKKDWLMRLEELTGYPALDEATLALQAMKDAGDYKAHSLLELLADDAVGVGGPPTNLRSLFLAGFQKAFEAGKGKIVGSPAEQTRAYLKLMEQQAKEARKAP